MSYTNNTSHEEENERKTVDFEHAAGIYSIVEANDEEYSIKLSGKAAGQHRASSIARKHASVIAP